MANGGGDSGGSAAVFGASGGIGGALCKALAERGVQVAAGSRSGSGPAGPGITDFRFDLADEASIAAAAAGMAGDPPSLVIVATGVLTLPGGAGPERGLRMLDPETMARMFGINTIGPALIAKHMLPLFARDQRSIFAALSAKVGSIGDNRIGGWHSYRMSKAALNMAIKTIAIELARTHRQAVAVALHPGTVDTALSRPFQRNLPAGQLSEPRRAAENLLAVIDTLTPERSGELVSWDGARLPY